MSTQCGEINGIKWSISDAVVKQLEKSGIDAIAEIKQALLNTNKTDSEEQTNMKE